MGAPKKLTKPIQITTILEASQHEALKKVAFLQGKPMAELLRLAVEDFISAQTGVLRQKILSPKRAC